MFKEGDIVIAIQDSEYGHYKRGQTYTVDSVKTLDSNNFSIKENEFKPFIKNFKLKKEADFTKDIKKLLE